MLVETLYLNQMSLCCRITVEVKRTRFPDPPKLPPVGHAARGPYAKIGQSLMAQDTYSQHIASFVDIRWQMVRDGSRVAMDS